MPLFTDTVRIVKRRFIWSGSWQLEDQADFNVDAGSPAIVSAAAYPGLLITPSSSKAGPPYYYSDVWLFDGQWKQLGCFANWALPGCGKVG